MANFIRPIPLLLSLDMTLCLFRRCDPLTKAFPAFLLDDLISLLNSAAGIFYVYPSISFSSIEEMLHFTYPFD